MAQFLFEKDARTYNQLLLFKKKTHTDILKVKVLWTR